MWIIMFIKRVQDMFDKDTRVTVTKTQVVSLVSHGLQTRGNTKDSLTYSKCKNRKTSRPKLLLGVTKDATVLLL